MIFYSPYNIGFSVMLIMTEIPPTAGHALHVADGDVVNQFVKPGTVEHRSMAEIMLQPTSLSLQRVHGNV